MAGHSHAANVMHHKAKQNAKKSVKFTRLVSTIYSCAKSSGADPSSNYQLRFAIDQAQAASVPKEKIENAIQRASGQLGGKALDSIRYNASIGAIAFVIECLTTNKNRSAAEIRKAVSDCGGVIVDGGGVEFLFDYVGEIVYPNKNQDGVMLQEDKVMEIALNAGCNDFIVQEDEYQIITEKADLHKVVGELKQCLGNPVSLGLIWKPKIIIQATDAELDKVRNMITDLEACEDVQQVFTNVDYE